LRWAALFSALPVQPALRLLSSMLFGVKAIDPVTFMLAAMLFLVVALAASYIPARRAAAVEPMAALRDS
jgi:putative ABC transport system permease protein